MIAAIFNKKELRGPVLIAAILLLHSLSLLQAQPFEFQRLSERERFLQGAVLSIEQDTIGFIWLGTRLGLYRYDGYSLKEFRHTQKDTQTISDNYVVTMHLDREGSLWAGTRNGLNLLDAATGRFSRFLMQQGGIGKDLNRINFIYHDTKGKLWIGTDGGLFSRPKKELTVGNHLNRGDRNQYLKGDSVRSIVEDREGNLFVGTNEGVAKLPKGASLNRFNAFAGTPQLANGRPAPITSLALDEMGRLWAGTAASGLYLLNPTTQIFEPFRPAAGSPGIIHPSIRKIVCDRQGRLWVGTQEGLSVIDPLQMNCTNYQHNPQNVNSLSQNSIYDIKVDAAGSIWIGTYFGGANMVYAFSTPFRSVQNNGRVGDLSNNVVSSFAEDHNQNLWIATEGGGINFWNRKTDRFTVMKNQHGNVASLSSNLVKNIFLDTDRNLWIGTHGGGLNLLNTVAGTITRMVPAPDSKFKAVDVTCVWKDSYNRIWVGTELTGLLIFDPATKQYRNYLSSENLGFGLKGQYVKMIYEDRHRNLFAATEMGLFKLESGKEVFEEILTKNIGVSEEIMVNCISEDGKGNLWIGTFSNGVYVLNAKQGTLKKNYREADGLAGNTAYGVVLDNLGYVWISTENGLSRLDPEFGTFINFRTPDGLPGNSFNNLAFFKDSKGTIFFGGFQGFTYFTPESIQVNDKLAKTIITGLQVGGTEVVPGDSSGILKEELWANPTLTLNHRQNIFTVRFANLNYIKSAKNRYTWMLQGMDNQWHYSLQPFATFTNLKPGTYTLLVKGSNNDGQWNEEPARLTIRILPPPWATWWAYFIYLLVVGSVAFFVARFLWLRGRFRRETAMQQFKLDFFTSLSHEIRTHLSLIIGPVERLLLSRHNDTELNSHLGHIKKNAGRLLSLVGEMMELRRAETNHVTLYKTEENLVVFLKEIFTSIESAAEGKHISMQFNCNEHSIPLAFDRIQMEKVFFNLLTNALKFTREGGEIGMRITQTGSHVIIAVEDNGMGIPPEHIDKVFKSYYQVHNGQTSHMGYGIGLALAKALVNLHNGTLEVESTPAQKGKDGHTRFLVTLPKNLNPDAIPAKISAPTAPIEAVTTEAPLTPNQTNRKPHILLIEDNEDLRHFLVESFQSRYLISEAGSGEDGLSFAIEQLPDLVVCDIMLPGMDGLMVCRKLKQGEHTSHIPVILLTAKASPEQQVTGMHSGADAYITKPFSLQLLELQINNLLASRTAMRQRYVHQVTLEPRQIEITNADEAFLNRLIEIIENHMDNPDFGVHMLRSQMAMSLTVLYKKLQALTGMSVNEFIKSIRLKKAAMLLKQTDYNISEISYRVGFNDRKYFSREFKKQFGKTPSEYATEPST